MGPSPITADLAASILRRPRGVVVLHGRARSGKTAAALEIYEQCAAGRDGPTCLLLAPDVLAVASLRARLLERSGCDAAVAPRVMTFDDLAGRILLAADLPHRPLSPVSRRAVLAGILAELAAAGELPTLANLLDAPGLVITVDRAIAELKHAGARSDDPALAGRGHAWHAEMLAVYRQYQSYLTQHQLYDDLDRYALARDHLAKMDGEFLAPLRAVVADGFTEFGHGQLEILQLLSQRAEHLVITLMLAGDGREELWRWSARQLKRLHRTFGDALCEMPAEPPQADESAPAAHPWPAALADRLLDGRAESLPWPDGLAFVSASGIDSECRAIARWVKAHLAAGARAEDLAIVARDISPYRGALAEVLAEAGLPAPAAPRPLLHTPIARLLMSLIRAADGLGYADILTVLSSSYFRPATLGVFSADTALAAQLLVRLGNVLEGREQYARAAAWLADRIARLGEPAGDEDEFASPMDKQLARLGPEGIAQAGNLLEALFTRLDPIAAGGTLAELATATRRLIAELDLPGRAGDDQTLAADLRALSAIDTVLAELAGLPGLERRLAPRQYADLLTAALGQASCPSEQPTGAVLAASVTQLRSMCVKHLWLAGLNEGVFPAPTAQQRLFNESDRQSLHRRGLSLDFQDDLAARELLLFYLAVSGTQESLTVSWLCDDGDGRALAPSFLAAELARPLGGLAGKVTTLPPAQFAPPPSLITGRGECFNLAFSTLAGRQGPADEAALAALGQAATLWPGELESMAWPLWAAHRRWKRGDSDAYDGVLDDPALLEELARRCGPTAIFSVSQLNTYLTCPWRYFAQRLLRLNELPEPEEALLPRQRGILVHSVLRRVMERLAGTPAADRRQWAGPQAREAVEAVLAQESVAGRAAGAAARAMRQIELDQIRAIILAYLCRQSTLALPQSEVRYGELAFGMGAAPGTDPASAPKPFALEVGGRQVLLRGKIDRVDVLTSPEGVQRCFVVDYKTGELPKPTEDVQLPVYIAAASQLTGLPAAGGAFHGLRAAHLQERYLADFTMSRGKLTANGTFDIQLRAGLDLVAEAVTGMAAGDFDIFEECRCPQPSCPYRRICGHSESRALYKAPVVQEQPEVEHG